jgi:glycogen(starch) synthase
MKLLIYSHFFSPSIGGAETVVASLARGLAETRSRSGSLLYDITLITQTPADNSADFQLPYRVIRQPSRDLLQKLIREADLVHVAGAAIPPILKALLCRKPVVVEHHGFQTICPTGQLFQEPQNIPCPGHFMNGNYSLCLRCRTSGNFRSSLRIWLLTFVRRLLCQRATVNIVPTAWLGNQLRLSRTEIVAHGLRPSPPLVRIRCAGETPSILFIGRLVTTKGVGLLLEAAHILQQEKRVFALLVVGAGPERLDLESRVRGLQLSSRVQFLGHLPQEQLDSLLAKAAAVVVPSLGGEVFGMVVAENMLRGVPVLASDLGAFVEVLGNAGLTFRTGDAADLAAKISHILENPALGTRLAEAAHQRVQEIFTEQRMIEAHSRIYQRLWGAASASGAIV